METTRSQSAQAGVTQTVAILFLVRLPQLVEGKVQTLGQAPLAVLAVAVRMALLVQRVEQELLGKVMLVLRGTVTAAKLAVAAAVRVAVGVDLITLVVKIVVAMGGRVRQTHTVVLPQPMRVGEVAVLKAHLPAQELVAQVVAAMARHLEMVLREP
jgi:hypothetical protein